MRELVVVVAVAVGLLALPTAAAPASAAWTSPSAGVGQAAATTLAAPSSLGASCNLLLDASVTLTWPASTSPWAGGYEVRWSTTAGGPYTNSSGIVTGLSWSTPALGLGTYYFVVRTAKGSWRSAPSPQASKTVVSLLLGLICL